MSTLESLPFTEESIDTIPDSFVASIETVQFCFFCFTVPFYILIISFVINAQKHKITDLSTPFFKLFLSTSIIDLLTLLANYFGAILPKWGWFRDVYLFLDDFYSHLYLYIAWFCGINQAGSAAILTANRLSAILFPNKYNQLWKGHNLHTAYFLQFAPGAFLSCLTLFNPTQLYRNKMNGLIPRFMNKSMTNAYFIIGGVYLCTICMFLLASYCLLFYMIRKRNKKNLQNHTHDSLSFHQAKFSAKRREFKLFIMSSIIVFVQFLLLFFFVIKAIGIIRLSPNQFHLINNAICDIYASINPYMIWIFSDSLRKRILKQIPTLTVKTPASTVILA